jgi:hypothetical protein
MMVEWINAAGGRAYERTIGTFSPRGEPRKDGSGRHDTTMHEGPWAWCPQTHPQGGTAAYNVAVVGVTHKDGFKGATARAEKKKHEHYNSHKKKCRDEGNTDSRLAVELIPSTRNYWGSRE